MAEDDEGFVEGVEGRCGEVVDGDSVCRAVLFGEDPIGWYETWGRYQSEERVDGGANGPILWSFLSNFRRIPRSFPSS
jgi:hypothetical protein